MEMDSREGLVSPVTTDAVGTARSASRWNEKVMALLDEGEDADQLALALQALLCGAAIAIGSRSPDADRDALLSIRCLSASCGLARPGSLVH
jgi:hypothetical protein